MTGLEPGTSGNSKLEGECYNHSVEISLYAFRSFHILPAMCPIEEVRVQVQALAKLFLFHSLFTKYKMPKVQKS